MYKGDGQERWNLFTYEKFAHVVFFFLNGGWDDGGCACLIIDLDLDLIRSIYNIYSLIIYIYTTRARKQLY